MLRKIAPMAMPGFLCPNLSIKCSVLFVLLGLFSADAHMPLTSPPLTFVYDSESFEAGDIIEIAFYYGDESNQVSTDTVFHLVHAYSGYDIESGSALTADLTGSWIGSSHTCTDSIWIDHDNRELHVQITSTEPVSGYGLAVTIGGIEIEIVDVTVRKGFPIEDLSSLVNIWPNPTSDYLRIEMEKSVSMRKIELFNLQGDHVRNYFPKGQIVKIAIQDLPSQMYLLKIETDGGPLTRRIKIIR